MATNSVQLAGDVNAIGARLSAGALARGGAAMAPFRSASFLLGACMVRVSWDEVSPGVVQVSYTLAEGACAELRDAAEREIERMLAAGDAASWKTPALVALLLLSVGFIVWQRQRQRKRRGRR